MPGRAAGSRTISAIMRAKRSIANSSRIPIMSSFFRPSRHVASLIFGSILCAAALSAQEGRHSPLPPSPFKYDLVLSGGHVLDAKNHRDAIMDVAVKDGKIAAVAAHVAPADAIKTVHLHGIYLTPGLIDIHVH